MPSFDVVSEVDRHELTNAVDQANRELTRRFDFRGLDAGFEETDAGVVLHAPEEFQLTQMLEILNDRLAKRDIDVRCLEPGDIEAAGKVKRQTFAVRQGIAQDVSKDLVKRIKQSKVKVQAQIQGEKLRVTGKKRDDLQQIIAMIREAELPVPLQFDNFRD